MCAAHFTSIVESAAVERRSGKELSYRHFILTLRSKTTPIKTMPIKMIVLSLVVLIAIAGAVAAVPLGRGSGHDAGSGNQDSGNGDSRISSAELEDLQTVANQFGISLQEATDRYAWNDNFALAVAQIREAFPEAFAGAEIVDGNRAWVAFAGQTPEAARAMIDTFGSTQSGISVEARADVGFTEVELQRAIKAAHFAVLEATHVLDASTLSNDRGVTVSRVTPRSRVIVATPRSTHRQSAPETGSSCSRGWTGVHGQRSVLELPDRPRSAPDPRSL